MKYQWLLTLCAIVGFSSGAFGRGGRLDAPFFGFPAGLDANQQKKSEIAIAFLRGELKFIDSYFVNSSFHHRFGGTAQQTSRFIQLLEDTKSWKVRVQFQDFGEQNRRSGCTRIWSKTKWWRL